MRMGKQPVEQSLVAGVGRVQTTCSNCSVVIHVEPIGGDDADYVTMVYGSVSGGLGAQTPKREGWKPVFKQSCPCSRTMLVRYERAGGNTP